MPGGKTYQIAHFQIFQGDQVRAYPGRPGRRVLAQPLHDAGAANPPNPQGPAGSVRIAADGSTAAFVPARRALTWQSTDGAGTPVVRERNWITFQAGEMRSCASCHGTNTANQAGLAAPANKPQALRELLNYWKTLPP
jgi:mono/diheme cytochrome c family protein